MLPLPGEEPPRPLVVGGGKGAAPGAAVVESSAPPGGDRPASPTGRILGRVVDVHRVPVEHAQVVLRQMLDLGLAIVPTGPSMEVPTDADGRFILDAVSVAHEYTLAVRRSGLADVFQHSIEVAIREDTDLGQLVMRATGAVEGVVTRGDGRPIAGATVTALVAGGIFAAAGTGAIRGQTDQRGGYRLDGLRPGSCMVQVSATGHAVAGRDDVIVPEGEVVSCDIQLDPELRIEGRVVDSLGFVPPSATVSCTRTDLGGGPVGITPAEVDPVSGDFILTGLAAGTYKVQASADGYGKTTRRNIQAGTTGELLVLVPEGGLDLSVADLTGRGADLFDVMLRRRSPALNLLATGYESPWSRIPIGSGAQGRAWLAPVRRGGYELFVTLADGSASSITEAKVIDGETTVVPLLQVDAPRRLIGSVVDASSGDGLEDVEVTCCVARGGSRVPDGQRWTDAQGGFSYPAPPSGDLLLRAWAAGYVMLEQPVPAERSGPTQLVLQPAGSIRVVLSELFMSSHAAQLDVLLEGPGGASVLQLDEGEVECTFSGLLPGTYSIVVEPVDEDDSEPADNSRSVEVQAGVETLVSF
jgi:hypothetical protein